MKTHQIAAVFVQMKLGLDLTQILPNETSKQYYFFIKAYKLVDTDSFFAYCKQHKQSGTITPFHQMLIDILDDHYPPLTPCHPTEEGYPELDQYVAIAKSIFKETNGKT